MSNEYDSYLREHKSNVAKAYQWFEENLPKMLKGDYSTQVCLLHDHSKDDAEEYDAYDAYFYGGNKSQVVIDNFNKAWLDHIHKNPHHWQHWVLINDDAKEGTVALEMPYNYVIEMICDWWSFSWKTGKLDEIFGWYEAHEKTMVLHPKTRELVVLILDMIKARVVYKLP